MSTQIGRIPGTEVIVRALSQQLGRQSAAILPELNMREARFAQAAETQGCPHHSMRTCRLHLQTKPMAQHWQVSALGSFTMGLRPHVLSS